MLGCRRSACARMVVDAVMERDDRCEMEGGWGVPGAGVVGGEDIEV
jgi:hypothetical protein